MAIVTSDLTGEELWALTSLGYAPIKLLMSTSIYSLGLTGGFLAAFKSFTRVEISELTRLVHDAREVERACKIVGCLTRRAAQYDCHGPSGKLGSAA